MTGVDYARRFVIPAALALLPDEMNTPEAASMLLAIGWQESRFTHRLQENGPARGFWQFELGGIVGVLGMRAERPELMAALNALSYPLIVLDKYQCQTAITHNDVVAAVFARLLLWSLPEAMPSREQPDAGWAAYLSAWRPGKPRLDSWSTAWAEAWA